MPSRRSGSGRVAISEVRDALTEVWEWSRVSPEDLGVVGSPSRWSERGREAFP